MTFSFVIAKVKYCAKFASILFLSVIQLLTKVTELTLFLKGKEFEKRSEVGIEGLASTSIHSEIYR
jgi:hypothetical protein